MEKLEMRRGKERRKKELLSLVGMGGGNQEIEAGPSRPR